MNKLFTAGIALCCFLVASISNAQFSIQHFHDFADLSGTEVGGPLFQDDNVFSGTGLFQSFFTGPQSEAEFSSDVAFDAATNQLSIDLFVDALITDVDPNFAEAVGELAVSATFDTDVTVTLLGITGNLLDNGFLVASFTDVVNPGQPFQVSAGESFAIDVFDSAAEDDLTPVERTGSLVFSVTTEPIPEPSTLPLIGMGLLAAAGRRKRMLA